MQKTYLLLNFRSPERFLWFWTKSASECVCVGFHICLCNGNDECFHFSVCQPSGCFYQPNCWHRQFFTDASGSHVQNNSRCSTPNKFCTSKPQPTAALIHPSCFYLQHILSFYLFVCSLEMSCRLYSNSQKPLRRPRRRKNWRRWLSSEQVPHRLCCFSKKTKKQYSNKTIKKDSSVNKQDATRYKRLFRE